MLTKIKIPVKKPYNLGATMHSHGWPHLLPNTLDQATGLFVRTERLLTGQVIRLSIQGAERGGATEIQVMAAHQCALTPAEKRDIRTRVTHMLRLDEDLAPFYAFCEAAGGRWRSFPRGDGYLLRSPGLFEDLVKVICTTNIQWGGTKRMITEIVAAFGSRFGDDPQHKSFPAPEDISSFSFEAFKEKARLGYRAEYIYQLAKDITAGKLDPGSFLDPLVPTREVRKRLLAIKGIGNYAAASALMLLGRYDFIPVDTIFRDYMQAAYFQNRTYSEAEALDLFEGWGKWKYLAYWTECMEYYKNR